MVKSIPSRTLSLAFLLVTASIPAAPPPEWWATTGAVIPYAPVENRAAATQGQAMAMVKRAKERLDTVLSPLGGAGQEINGLLRNYTTGATSAQIAEKNNRAILLGQLKFLAAPFWKRLQVVGAPGIPLAPDRPYQRNEIDVWTETTSDDADNAIATLGQIKMAFSFDIPSNPPQYLQYSPGNSAYFWQATIGEGFVVSGTLAGDQQLVSNTGGSTTTGFSSGTTISVINGSPLVTSDEDKDGDGVLDELEAIPNDPNFTYPKSQESSYVAIWLDQLTGAEATPRNADNSLPKLISMNDNGQLFFDYTPPVSGGTPRRTILVWDQGVYTAMPPFSFHGQPATITTLAEPKSSTFGGGSIVFRIDPVMDDPIHPKNQYAGRYVMWSKANNWGAPVIGDPPSTPILDPVPLRLDPETNEYPGGTIDDTVAGEMYWSPADYDAPPIYDYDNLGNLLGSTRQYAPEYVTIPSSDSTSVWTDDWRGVCLCSRQGTGLATGPSYPDAHWSATRTSTWNWTTSWDLSWSLKSGPTFYGFPDSVHSTSPSGRTRVTLYEGSNNVPRVPTTWYQGEAGDPFKTVIFQNAAPDAFAVNSWDAEPKPPAGSKAPYRQGPLFITSSTLATLTGTGPTAQWHALTTAIVADGSSSILNDRAEVLTGLFLWRNNRLIDLSPTINSTKPANHPGLAFHWTVTSFLNNQGVIAATHTRPFGGEWLNHTALLIPMEVNCPELYMFSGHKNDVVELCTVSGITCQWKLKDASPVIGTFNHPTDTACSFTATAAGKNVIQLLIGGNVAWEKPTEILPITTRAAWGAVAAKAHTKTIPNIQHITLHHTSNTGTGWAEMQRIQKLHMSLFPYNLFGGKDFDDIGYHLIMDKNGDVFEGRQIEGSPGKLDGPYTKGEHVGSNNTVAGFGLCTMGDYEASEGNETWPAGRQKAIEKVISAVCRRYKLTKDKISTHKSMALPASPSLCPGSNYIPTIPDIIKHVEENLR